MNDPLAGPETGQLQKRSPIKRWAILVSGAALLALVVFIFPPAAAPVGVALATLEILHRMTRQSR
ncbi:hypothetical protein GCM10009555_047660 [Acrocarpospora macrocephala]|uniref:Uncharacterized protein n=2 Tax=Acrocarpospora TaxID=90974 RepID=A0A5M3Y3N2_9ACTN|nr:MULTISPECIES: hypothetical protein [Acrocarpospora]GES12107.1 hypothetical protein Amac_057040 [Acrocarpospora macrocephala]GES26623.1 hypothetical protein Aple_095220 [Acrocarpospora pleiomorpha]